MKTFLRNETTRRLGLTLGLLAIFGIVLLVRPSIFKTPSPHWDSFVSADTGGLELQLSIEPPSALDIAEVTVTGIRYVNLPLDASESPTLPDASVTGVEYQQPSGNYPTEICVDYLRLFFQNALAPHLEPNLIAQQQSPNCYTLDFQYEYSIQGLQIQAFELEDLELPAYSATVATRDSVWYPYDGFDIVFGLDTQYSLVYRDQPTTVQSSANGLAVELTDASSWTIKGGYGSVSDPELPRDSLNGLDTYALRVRRPLFAQLVFPHAFLIMLALILLLCFVDRVETFIEGAVALFFGIFGFTQVLKPSAPDVRTLVDIGTWGLYFAVAGTLIHHLSVQVGHWWRVSTSKPPVLSDPPLPPEPPPAPPPEPSPQPNPDGTQKAAGLLLLGAVASLVTWLLYKARLRQ